MSWDNIGFKKLEELNRFTSLINTKVVLSENTIDKINESLEHINNLCNLNYNYENISEKKLQYLQQFLDNFLGESRGKIRLITDSEQELLVYIVCNIDKLKVDSKVLSHPDNYGTLLFLFRKIDRKRRVYAETFIMKYFLMKDNHDRRDLRSLIINLFDKKNEKDNLYIPELKYYLTDTFFNEHTPIGNGCYKDVLENIGIRPEFRKCDFFNYQFFEWFMNIDVFTVELFKLNKEYLKILTISEKKVILAKLICDLHSLLSASEFEEEYNQISKFISIESKIDKTEKEYWIVNQELETERNLKYLDKAYQISLIMFSRDIITQFFDILGEEDDVSLQRAGFWYSYCESESFLSIKVILTKEKEIVMRNSLKESNRKLFSNFLIRNLSNNISESPALLIVFDNITVIEFTKTGNATRLFYTGDEEIEDLLKSKYISGTKELRDLPEAERIVHSGYWLNKTKELLDTWDITY